MKEWFASWFDTHYYHVLYKDRDHKEAELFIQNLFNYLKVSELSRVLDLACGKGRHSTFINSLGYRTTGVDLSKDSICYANQFKTASLDFFVHDMREPIKDFKFDLVVNLFTSFGYFDNIDENQKVLRSIASYLNKNGILVIDFLNLNHVTKNLIPYEEKLIDGINFKIAKKIDKGFILKNIVFEDKGKQFDFQEKVQALTLTDFESILQNENFEIIDVFGNYNLDPLQTSSDRLIIIAKRR